MLNARVVIDTNVLISHLLVTDSSPSRAVRHALAKTQLLVSESTLSELADVLGRKKFDALSRREDRQAFLRLIARVAETVPITTTVRACRDPQDDKFLELAVSGSAHWIVSGEQDLLTLTPYEGCAIVTPAQFLALPDAALAGVADSE